LTGGGSGVFGGGSFTGIGLTKGKIAGGDILGFTGGDNNGLTGGIALWKTP
jgi:hypothetical protein